MSYVRTYSPEDVVIIVGDNEISGWNKIKVERTSPVFKHIEGIRGSVARTRTLKSSATITLNIDQNSTSNLALSMLLALDDADKMSDLLTVAIKDNNNLTVEATSVEGGSEQVYAGTAFTSFSCYIEGYPDVELTDESVERVWTLRVMSTDLINIGQGYSLREYLINQGLKALSPFISDASAAISSSLTSVTRFLK